MTTGYKLGERLTDDDRDTCESCGSPDGWPHLVHFKSPSGRHQGDATMWLCSKCKADPASAWKAVKLFDDRRFKKLAAPLRDAIVADSVQFRRGAGYYRETPEQRKLDDAAIERVIAFDAGRGGGKRRHGASTRTKWVKGGPTSWTATLPDGHHVSLLHLNKHYILDMGQGPMGEFDLGTKLAEAKTLAETHIGGYLDTPYAGGKRRHAGIGALADDVTKLLRK
jgi:hypothetical protein